MKNEINIKCENEGDRDLIFIELVKIIKKLGNEKRLKGAVEYG